MKNNQRNSLFMLICSMLIFGTIGIFRRYIPLSSEMLACTRGFLGGFFLLVCILIKGKSFKFGFSKKQIFLLSVTGVVLGANWIFLFESYNYTSIAVSTLCYYMQPTIVMLLSPVLFQEKLTLKKLVCVIISIVGIALVSGVTNISDIGLSDIKGIIFGLGAADLYSMVIILNKKNPIDDVYGKTIVQLFSAAIILLPYLFLKEDINDISLNTTALIMIFVVGILHTGIAYALYFGSMNGLKSQTVAVMSYIDPISAIILSAVLLKEKMTILSIIGAIMVMGAAIVSEINLSVKKE
jgi:drug/metabolite transporter (DMT)-like permease